MLHRLVREHLGDLLDSFADGESVAGGVPKFVEKEFRAYLDCGNPELGFLRLRCERCGHIQALPFSCKGRTICPSCATRRMQGTAAHLVDRVLPDVPLRQWVLSPPFELLGLLAARGAVLSKMAQFFVRTVFGQMTGWAASQGLDAPQCGAVTFIQRFSKTLTVYPHLHLVVIDGVYTREDHEQALTFHPCPAPSSRDLLNVAQRVFQKMEGYLRAEGYLCDHGEEQELTATDQWYQRSIGESSGLEKIPRLIQGDDTTCGGFTVHAGVHVPAGDKGRREQLCRYAARPPFAEDQFRELKDGRIKFTMRRPAKNGQTSILLGPHQLMRRLAWLVPPPRQHQVRFHGLLAPAAIWRPEVIPRPPPRIQPMLPSLDVAGSRRKRIAWAQLLRRVYDIDAERCVRCGGRLRVVEAVTDPDRAAQVRDVAMLARAPPGQLQLPLTA